MWGHHDLSSAWSAKRGTDFATAIRAIFLDNSEGPNRQVRANATASYTTWLRVPVTKPRDNSGNSNTNPILSPSQLGYTGGLSIFGGTKVETAPFKGEPTRDSLTQPPVGYQTPSPNFAYGTGPKESLNKEYNPAAGKYGE